MAKRKRTPEENARREAIRELLQMSNIESIESADEVNGVAALLIVLMEPQVSADSDLLRSVLPFIFRAGSLECFSLSTEQFTEIRLPSLLLLLVSKMNVFRWHEDSFLLLLCMVVPFLHFLCCSDYSL